MVKRGSASFTLPQFSALTRITSHSSDVRIAASQSLALAFLNSFVQPTLLAFSY